MDRPATLVALGWSANDPHVLAHFWATTLGWVVRPAGDDEVVLVPTDPTSFRIVFRRATTPKLGQSRIHIDVTTASLDDQREMVAQLIGLGGRHEDVGQGADDDHVVLADPEGNELCVLAPFNNFLAGCPRLGAVNCDGTHALGRFWSAALGWPLVWDQDEETAIQAPEGTGPKITWSGPPLMPVHGPERIRFEVQGDADRLVDLGATRVAAVGDRQLLADVDGNELVVFPRLMTP